MDGIVIMSSREYSQVDMNHAGSIKSRILRKWINRNAKQYEKYKKIEKNELNRCVFSPRYSFIYESELIVVDTDDSDSGYKSLVNL